MKNILIALGLFISVNAVGQLTVEHSYIGTSRSVGPTYTINLGISVVNLSISGKKYAVQSMVTSQVFLYNLDHSLWKTINLPSFPFSYPNTAYYISENLFKIDGLVDMVVVYNKITDSVIGTPAYTSQVIINEFGTIINKFDSCGMLQIYSTGNDTFKAIGTYNNLYDTIISGEEYSKFNSVIYALPGTIPCNICGNGLGLGKAASPTNTGDLYPPIPNPSSDQVRINYSLPYGVTQGAITFYNSTGQQVKSVTVDNNFQYIIVDNTSLPPGMYYYSLSAKDMQSTARKMIVIR